MQYLLVYILWVQHSDAFWLMFNQGFAIGNGLTNPEIQYEAYTDYALENNLIKKSDHDSINKAVPKCKQAIQLCGKLFIPCSYQDLTPHSVVECLFFPDIECHAFHFHQEPRVEILAWRLITLAQTSSIRYSRLQAM